MEDPPGDGRGVWKQRVRTQRHRGRTERFRIFVLKSPFRCGTWEVRVRVRDGAKRSECCELLEQMALDFGAADAGGGGVTAEDQAVLQRLQRLEETLPGSACDTAACTESRGSRSILRKLGRTSSLRARACQHVCVHRSGLALRRNAEPPLGLCVRPPGRRDWSRRGFAPRSGASPAAQQISASRVGRGRSGSLPPWLHCSRLRREDVGEAGLLGAAARACMARALAAGRGPILERRARSVFSRRRCPFPTAGNGVGGAAGAVSPRLAPWSPSSEQRTRTSVATRPMVSSAWALRG